MPPRLKGCLGSGKRRTGRPFTSCTRIPAPEGHNLLLLRRKVTSPLRPEGIHGQFWVQRALSSKSFQGMGVSMAPAAPASKNLSMFLRSSIAAYLWQVAQLLEAVVPLWPGSAWQRSQAAMSIRSLL